MLEAYAKYIFLFTLIGFAIYYASNLHYEVGDFKYTICNDGYTSYSRNQGTCSHHGGVKDTEYELIYGLHWRGVMMGLIAGGCVAIGVIWTLGLLNMLFEFIDESR